MGTRHSFFGAILPMIEIQHVHPILVHFPIVLIYTLVVIDLVALASRRAVTVRSGVGTISTFVALSAGAFAAVTWFYGGLALDYAEAAGFSSDVAEKHEALGGITALVFLMWGFARLVLLGPKSRVRVCGRRRAADRTCRRRDLSLSPPTMVDCLSTISASTSPRPQSPAQRDSKLLVCRPTLAY